MSVRRGLLAPVLALLAACPGSSNPDILGGPERGCLKTVQIVGRVVDFESCISSAGCQGVQDLRVALFYDSTVISDKTRPDGAFVLKGVPNGVRNYLLVTDAGAAGTHLSSLQATPVITKGSDVFGVELFVLKREVGLYAAVSQELSVDVGKSILYFAQVFALEKGGMKALAGASVATSPATAVRFVDCNPRMKSPPCPVALFDATRTTTGPFGEFVLSGKGPPGDLAISVSAPDRVFVPLLAPLGPGYVTIGLHPAQATGDGGPAPPDLKPKQDL
jgi:hypothetical protein